MVLSVDCAAAGSSSAPTAKKTKEQEKSEQTKVAGLVLSFFSSGWSSTCGSVLCVCVSVLLWVLGFSFHVTFLFGSCCCCSTALTLMMMMSALVADAGPTTTNCKVGN